MNTEEKIIKIPRVISKQEICVKMENMLSSFKPLFLSLCNQPRYYLIREESMSICFCKCIELVKDDADTDNPHFPGLLKKCLINELNNAVRKAARNQYREGTELDKLGMLPQLIVDEEDKLLDRLVLEEAWKKLSFSEKRILRMYFGQQKTQKEIAEVLHIRQGTVAKELAKVLKHLRELCS